jgi:hypothetical protein
MFSKNGLQGVRTVAATGVMIAGLTLGLCRGASAQAAGTAAAEGSSLTAQQKADAARERAAELASAGGWAYKTGAVAQAMREAARYQAEADRVLAQARSCVPPAPLSPAQGAALARAEELRQAGGWAYKTGAVARAEREAQLAAPQLAAEPVPPSPARAAALARLEELRRAGGWAYKTGAVARAAAEAEALAVAPQQTAVCRPEEVGALSSPTTSSAI